MTKKIDNKNESPGRQIEGDRSDAFRGVEKKRSPTCDAQCAVCTDNAGRSPERGPRATFYFRRLTFSAALNSPSAGIVSFQRLHRLSALLSTCSLTFCTIPGYKYTA